MLRKLLVFTQAILFVSGCTAFQGYPERPSDLESDLSETEPYVSAGKIKTCLGIIEPPTEGRDGGATGQTGPRPLISGNAGATTSVDDTTARACRDQLVAARMYATDLRFSQFEERLFRQTRESGFAAT